MITFLFFVFVALTIFHFIYDGIIAPSLRLETRMSLFEIRDDLRRIKIDNEAEFTDELFDDLQNGVNKQIKFLHEINLTGILGAFKAVLERTDLKARFEEHQQRLKDCNIPEVKELHDKSALTFLKAVLINSGGWLIYIIPLVVTGLLCTLAWSKLKGLAVRVLETPDSEMQSYFGDSLYN